MATFPAITPNGRSLALGDYPQLEYVGTSGVPVRFLQNTKRVQQRLSLVYNSLTETNVNAIYNHFDGQQGSLIPFPLPAAIWAGYSSVPISVLDYQWRYANTLSITPTAPGRFNVTVELESDII